MFQPPDERFQFHHLTAAQAGFLRGKGHHMAVERLPGGCEALRLVATAQIPQKLANHS